MVFDQFTRGLDAASFDLNADPVDRVLERDFNGYENNLMAERGRSLRRHGQATVFDFAKTRARIFWLNSKQMDRARRDGL